MMSDIVNLQSFCKNHDFKYYDDLSDTAKHIFEKIIQSNYDTLGTRTVVETIILNHTHPNPPPPIRRVIGPMSKTVIKVDDKIMYLFGDVHIARENCPKGEEVKIFGESLLEHSIKIGQNN